MVKEIQISFQLAFVTGATSGIGEALSHLLADKGTPLFITGRDPNKLDLLVETLSKRVKVTAFRANLENPEERKALITKIHTFQPDLVINNAGFGLYGEALTHETETQSKILEVDGQALLELTLEAARTLISHGKEGVILNVASAAAFYVFPTLAVYSAVKAFVVNFSKALDFETKAHGVRVLTSCPGMIETNFSKRAGATKKTGVQQSLVMDARFAAERILKQIEQRKVIDIFDWKTRLSTYLSYLIPKKWLIKILRSSIESRLN
jgi:uncharacterized protein